MEYNLWNIVILSFLVSEESYQALGFLLHSVIKINIIMLIIYVFLPVGKVVF